MKVALGADHAGYRYKEEIKSYLIERGHEVVDFGTDSTESVDYPLFIRPAGTFSKQAVRSPTVGVTFPRQSSRLPPKS